MSDTNENRTQAGPAGDWLRQAAQLHQDGRIVELESLCRQVLQSRPDASDALNLLGIIADRVGQREMGVDYLRRAVDANPGVASYHANLGGLLQKLGRPEMAIEACRSALALDPKLVAAHYNLGNALRDAERADEAIAAFESALQHAPSHTGARTNLANLLLSHVRDTERAVSHYEAVIRLKPTAADGYNNLAAALLELDRFDMAERHARAAVARDAGHSGAHNNLGVALQYQGKIDEAIAAYRSAIELAPGYAEAHQNLFWALQLSGRLQEGWHEHAWRERVFPGSILKLPFERWDGSSLKGRSLVVYAEQGIGDEIMFASCLGSLIDKAETVTVQCEPRLGPLFTRSFPGARVCAEARDAPSARWRRALTHAQLQSPAGDLPHHLRRDFGEFGSGDAYLQADTSRVGQWRERLGELGDGLKIGLAWRGGARPKDRRRRSIPPHEWQPVVAVPGVQFVSLQYGHTEAELEALGAQAGVTVHAFNDLDTTGDLDGLAALISALDLVVSVDNSTVHLAGALGARTWTLLPFMPDWRWYLGRDDTPWYESVSLYRQPGWGGWSEVLSRVAADLAELSAQRR